MAKTITALATAPGVGGIAVVRISGDNAFEIADRCFAGKVKIAEAKSHTIHYGDLVSKGKLIDKVTVFVYRAPHSFTGENVVEVGCHGGMIISKMIIEALIDAGAEYASPGEFTRRAFVNGKLDLTQVEAVADMIHSVSIPGSQTSARQLSGEFTQRLSRVRQSLLDVASLAELELDFADEDLEFVPPIEIIDKIKSAIEFCKDLAESYTSAEILREGFYVGLCGYPNSGKSTLFNALIQKERAIVSEIPGTTRDYIEESMLVGGLPIKIIDTAGIRESDDVIEIQGIKLVESVLEQSNVILVINDSTKGYDNSRELSDEISAKYSNAIVLTVQNKNDLIENDEEFEQIKLSAKNREGIDVLKNIIAQHAEQSIHRVSDILVNKRHSALLDNAVRVLTNCLEQMNTVVDNVAIAYDIRAAAKSLGEISGESWNEDVLNNIFSRFCIGK